MNEQVGLNIMVWVEFFVFLQQLLEKELVEGGKERFNG